MKKKSILILITYKEVIYNGFTYYNTICNIESRTYYYTR